MNRQHRNEMTDMTTRRKTTRQLLTMEGAPFENMTPAALERIATTSEALTTVEVRLSPAQAEALIPLIDNVRSCSDAKIVAYSEVMDEGGWEMNGETIKVGRSGRIVDGEHRIRAVTLCKAPVLLAFTFGVSGSDTIDSGRPRHTAQFLSRDGVKNSSIVAAVGVRAMTHQEVIARGELAYAPTLGRRSEKRTKQLAFMRENLRLLEAVGKICSSIDPKRAMRASEFGTVAFLTMRYFRPGSPGMLRIEDWLRCVASPHHTPAFEHRVAARVREAIIATTLSKRGTWRQGEQMTMLAIALEAESGGRLLKKFQVYARQGTPGVARMRPLPDFELIASRFGGQR